jgi:hypothetical protein
MSANLLQNGQPHLPATTLTGNLKTLSKAIFPRFQTAANTWGSTENYTQSPFRRITVTPYPSDSSPEKAGENAFRLKQIS